MWRYGWGADGGGWGRGFVVSWLTEGYREVASSKVEKSGREFN